MHEPISVLFCSNRTYCEPMATAITSLLKSNPRHWFRIFIMLSEPAEKERRYLTATIHRFSNAEFTFIDFKCDKIRYFPTTDHIPIESYFRYFLDQFLPSDVEKVLYLDCDLIVRSDIEELWRTPLEGHVLAAVPDQFSDNLQAIGFREDEPYFNGGVLLFNVCRWREVNQTKHLLAYIDANGPVLRYHDQDAINVVLRGEIVPLHPTWNFTPRHAESGPGILGLSMGAFIRLRNDPAIIHFTGIKPWRPNCEPHYKDHYLHYRSLTPWGSDEGVLPTQISAPVPRSRAQVLKQKFKWQFPRVTMLLRRLSGAGDPMIRKSIMRGGAA
jgi:lipopolysaccharide biosynthesis glycosyltransferase